MDVTGQVRITGDELNVTEGDAYNIRLLPYGEFYYGTGVIGSALTFGAVFGSLSVNETNVGSIPANSLLLGGASPNCITAMTDFLNNPMFVAGGNGSVTINGGYDGINNGNISQSANANATSFYINGGLGTGSGIPGDIVFSTGSSQPSGTAIHTMANRWLPVPTAIPNLAYGPPTHPLPRPIPMVMPVTFPGTTTIFILKHLPAGSVLR